MVRTRLLAVIVLLALVAGLSPIGPQPAGAEVEGLAEAREAARQAAQDLADVETRLGELDLAISEVETQTADVSQELEDLLAAVQELAVQRYITAGVTPSINDEDLNRQARNNALARIVTQGDGDVLDEYRAVADDLEAQSTELADLREQEQEALRQLEENQQRVEADLARLEELERQRLQAERRWFEEQARRAAAEEAARRAAAAVEAALAAGDDGEAESVPAVPIAEGDWVCPVQGARSFVDSWGAPRSGGRRHKGVDILAARDTPIVSPVSGVVSHRSSGLGGKSFYLDGDDGNFYYGAHLDSYGHSGWVEAGTVIGFNGDTGNALGTPHLHFEIHPGGQGNPTNPYPVVVRYC